MRVLVIGSNFRRHQIQALVLMIEQGIEVQRMAFNELSKAMPDDLALAVYDELPSIMHIDKEYNRRKAKGPRGRWGKLK